MQYICAPLPPPPPAPDLPVPLVSPTVDAPAPDQTIARYHDLLHSYAIVVPTLDWSPDFHTFAYGIEGGITFKYRSTPWVDNKLSEWAITVSRRDLKFPEGWKGALEEKARIKRAGEEQDLEPRPLGEVIRDIYNGKRYRVLAADALRRDDSLPHELYHGHARVLGVPDFERLRVRVYVCYQSPGQTCPPSGAPLFLFWPVEPLLTAVRQVLNLTAMVKLASDFILPIEMMSTAKVSDQRAVYYRSNPNEPSQNGNIALVELRAILAMLRAGHDLVRAVE
ncbi:hypothetical protein JCM1840_006815 [Sporobolomyces johnsonii]